MLFRPATRTSIPASAAVFDAFGVQIGRVWEVEPERILIGPARDQSAVWIRRKAVMAMGRNGVTLCCARNRLAEHVAPSA